MTTIVLEPKPALFAPASRELALNIDELESLDALDFAAFAAGVGVGLGLVGLVAAGIAIT